MNYKKLKTLKSKVLNCLQKYPGTRDNDKILINAVIYDYYNEYLFQDEKKDWCIKLLYMYKIPNPESIIRIRAKIQNVEKKYLPTSEEIFKQRGWQEEEYRKFLGYNPELRQITLQEVY